MVDHTVKIGRGWGRPENQGAKRIGRVVVGFRRAFRSQILYDDRLPLLIRQDLEGVLVLRTHRGIDIADVVDRLRPSDVYGSARSNRIRSGAGGNRPSGPGDGVDRMPLRRPLIQ